MYPTRRNISIVDSISLSDFIIVYREPEGWIKSCARVLKNKERVPWSDYIDFMKINKFSNEELIEYVITFEFPKYLTFLSGWENAKSFYKTKNKAYFVNFDDLVHKPSATLKEILFLFPQLKSNVLNQNEFSTNVNRRFTYKNEFKLSYSDKDKIKSMCKQYKLDWVYK